MHPVRKNGITADWRCRYSGCVLSRPRLRRVWSRAMASATMQLHLAGMRFASCTVTSFFAFSSMQHTRQSTYPITPQFLERSSPRALVPEPLQRAQVEQIVEAARWAPSANNLQPWHFAYALRGDAHWDAFCTIPNAFNRRWCLNAGALVVVLSNPEASAGKHAFDTGCAWGFMALEAHNMGLATHAMAGIEMDAARSVLQLPEHWTVQAVIAVGRRGDPASLPEDLAAREVQSPRKPLHEILSAGPLKA